MLNKVMKNKKILTLAIGLSVSSLTYAQYNQDQRSTYSNQEYKSDNMNNDMNRNIDANISDQELTDKIRKKISSGWFSEGYDQVNAQVNNGVVTLQGAVKTQEDKENLEKDVRDMNGVRSLNSRINVLEPTSNKEMKDKFAQDSYYTSSDDQLNKKIRDKVSRGWLWDSYKAVVLNTSNGVVTLEGTVDDVKDQDKLVSEIQKVPGVKAVKSNLTIKNF
ncbi:MAG: BON domain-containing protein [Parachlamydiaceae bacterium]|nr:BON domain-containing protein [Parachlamydiaceae bacterium]